MQFIFKFLVRGPVSIKSLFLLSFPSLASTDSHLLSWTELYPHWTSMESVHSQPNCIWEYGPLRNRLNEGSKWSSDPIRLCLYKKRYRQRKGLVRHSGSSIVSKPGRIDPAETSFLNWKIHLDYLSRYSILCVILGHPEKTNINSVLFTQFYIHYHP